MRPLAIVCFIYIALLSLKSTATTESSSTNSVVPPNFLLSVVLTEPRPGAEATVKKYLEGAFPIAQARGMREIKTFDVVRILNGEETPKYTGLYSWPSAEAASGVRESKEYVEHYKPLREKAWHEMMAVDVSLSEPWQPVFDPDHTYTLALVWLASVEDYESYQSASKTVRESLGVRTIFLAPALRIDYLQNEKKLRAPDRVALLEWPNAQAALAYRQTLSEEPYASKAASAFERVDWFEIKPH